MNYWLIFGLCEKDNELCKVSTGELFTISFAIEYDGIPSIAHLNDLAYDKTLSHFIGITGMTKLSEDDYNSYILNSRNGQLL